MKSRPRPRSSLGVSSVVGALILTLLFISMLTGLIVIQNEHRTYMDALSEFQRESTLRAAEELEAAYVKDGGRLVVSATNHSPLTIQVAYVVISKPDGTSLIINVSRAIPPGLSATVLDALLSESFSSVSLVTSRGRIFTARRVDPSARGSQGDPLREWPDFTIVSVPAKPSQCLLAVSDEVVAWTDGTFLMVYDWSGTFKALVTAERGIQGLAAFSDIIIYVDGDYLKAVRSDGSLLWRTPGFSSDTRPYLCVEETGTVYVKTYIIGYSRIHAVDINTGRILLRIDEDGPWSYVRSDGRLTIIATRSWVALYSRGERLSSLNKRYLAAWVDADRGIIALAPQVYSEIQLELRDLSFNGLWSTSIKPPVTSVHLVIQDLELTEGGMAILYLAILSGSYERQLRVMCINSQGKVTFDEFVTSFGTSDPPAGETAWFKEFLLRVWSFALCRSPRPKLFNSSLIMELPMCEAVAATKLGKVAFVYGGALKLTSLPHVPKPLSEVSVGISRSYVLLRSGGPPQKVLVSARTQSSPSITEAALKLVSIPQGTSYRFSNPSGSLPLDSELWLWASGVPEGKYIAEVIAEAKRGVIGRNLLVLDVRSGPALIKYSSTLTTSPDYLFFSTSSRFRVQTVGAQPPFDVMISYEASTAVAGEWGGVIHEIFVPKDLPGPPYVTFRIEDGYDGPRGAWEARVMAYRDGTWSVIWREDLGGVARGFRSVQASLEGVANPGDRVFVAIALACLSHGASTSNVWVKLSGIGLPSSPSGYYLTVYSKDRILIGGVSSGQVVKVYARDGTLLGRAEATETGELLVSLSEGALSPYRDCILEVFPVNGATWTTSATLYGGDILLFTG